MSISTCDMNVEQALANLLIGQIVIPEPVCVGLQLGRGKCPQVIVLDRRNCLFEGKPFCQLMNIASSDEHLRPRFIYWLKVSIRDWASGH